MSRPPKPFAVIKSEGRSHRTKAELEQRKKAEEERKAELAKKQAREELDKKYNKKYRNKGLSCGMYHKKNERR